MCAALYPSLSERLAMKIGGEDRPKWIIAGSWERLATDCGIGFKLVKQTLEKLSRALQDQAPEVAGQFKQSQQASDVTAAIRQVIVQRSNKRAANFAAAAQGLDG